MMIEFHIDTATVDDIPTVLAMMAALQAIDGSPFNTARTERNLWDFVGNNELGRLFVIRSTAETLGYLALTFGYSFEYGGKDAFIDEFFIREEFRNMGIGKATLAFVENQARELGIHALHLEVDHYNTKANRLYLHSGFQGKNRTLLTQRIEAQ